MKTTVTFLAALAVLGLAPLSTVPARAGGPTPGGAAPAAAEANPTYLRDVEPILMGKCARCHSPQSELPNWMDYKTAFARRLEIKRRVWDSFHGHYYMQPMPAGFSPEAAALTEAERATIKEWAESGGALGTPAVETSPQSRPGRLEHGRQLFASVCAACHQTGGQGVPGKFPPLAHSDFLNANKDRAIGILLHGRQGEITVNGQSFNNSMPRFPLSDEDIASALTYVYSSFGNSGQDVTPADVKAARAEKPVEIPAATHELAHNTAANPFE